MAQRARSAHVEGLQAAGSSEPAALAVHRALRELTGGVSIVTSGKVPARTGFMTTSVFSLSVDPMSMVVAVDRASPAYAVIREHGYFAVSILASQHDALAARFAGDGGLKGEALFAGECWHTLATDAAVLCDALAAVDCRLEELIERDSHAIAIGRVVAMQARGIGDALLYWRGDYHRLPQPAGEQFAAEWAPLLRAGNVGSG